MRGYVSGFFSILQFLAVGLGVLFFLGLGIGSTASMPENALVLVDHQTRYYIAPPCAEDYSPYDITTAADAHRLGYRPEPRCRDEGGFVQDGRSVSGMLLEKLGLLKPVRSRWNADGTWNW